MSENDCVRCCSDGGVRPGVARAFTEIARIAGQDDRTFNRDAVYRHQDDVDTVRPGEGGVAFRPYVRSEGGTPYALATGAGRPIDTRENLRKQMMEGKALVDEIRKQRPDAMPGLMPASRRMGNGRQAANDAYKNLTRTGLPTELVTEQRFGRRMPGNPLLYESERDVTGDPILTPYAVAPQVDLRHATGQSVPRGMQVAAQINNFEAVDSGSLYYRAAAVSGQAAYGDAGKVDFQQSLRDAYSFPGRYNFKSNTFCGPCGRADPQVPSKAVAADEGFFSAGCAPNIDYEEAMYIENKRRHVGPSRDALCGIALAAAAYAALRLSRGD